MYVCVCGGGVEGCIATQIKIHVCTLHCTDYIIIVLESYLCFVYIPDMRVEWRFGFPPFFSLWVCLCVLARACVFAGLTSPGGKLTEAAERTPVGIFCEGKEHAVCVGITTMSTADIASKNKGIGIEVIHFLNDGLWCMDPSKIF